MQRPTPASVSTPAPRTAALVLRARRGRWWRWWRGRRRRWRWGRAGRWRFRRRRRRRRRGWRGWRRRSARPTAAVVVRRRRRAVRADGVLPARERVPSRQDRRHPEIDRARLPDRREHERLPDRRREGGAGNRDPVHVQHRDLAARIADPNRRFEVRRIAAEPGVGVAVRCARLARGGAAEIRTGASAVLNVVLENLRDGVSDPLADHPLALRLTPAGIGVFLAIPEQDLADRHRLRVDPAGGERRVRRGQIERRDRDWAKAEGWNVGALLGR